MEVAWRLTEREGHGCPIETLLARSDRPPFLGIPSEVVDYRRGVTADEPRAQHGAVALGERRGGALVLAGERGAPEPADELGAHRPLLGARGVGDFPPGDGQRYQHRAIGKPLADQYAALGTQHR